MTPSAKDGNPMMTARTASPQMKTRMIPRPLRLTPVLLLVCLLVAARAAGSLDRLDSGFSDNLMRLVEVRDWLGGQGWFDMIQHRLLPPEGVSMHWSRYVDAGIAALLVPLSWVLPMELAETVTLVLWPSLLLLLLCLVVAKGSARLFGPMAALGAGLMVLFWSKIGPGKFGPGSLDHHNVQILLSTAALYLALVPARDPQRGPALLGAAAGATAALALAVGLEMLPMLLLLWGLVALRFALGAPGGGAWLAGFSVSLSLTAPLLMIGQTAPSEWLLPWCDELAPPLLALLAVGAAAGLAGIAAGRHLRAPLGRFAVMAVVAGLGLWLTAPLTGHCLSGPYGAMPDEARHIIEDRIAEAQPAWRSFLQLPFGVNALVTPALAVTLLASVLGWSARRGLTPAQRQALVIALAIAWVGLALSMVQIRALAVAAPAVPLLAGFVLWRIATLVSDPRHRRAAMGAALAGLAFVVLPQAPLALALAATGWAPQSRSATPAEAEGWRPLSGACRSQDTRRWLADLALPQGSIVLSELNFGAMILTHTPYAATSAGYHRSGDAFLAGVIPFQRAEDMIRMLRRTRADYVLICRTGGGSGAFGAQLLAGDLPPWLGIAPVSTAEILLLAVDKAALAAEPAGAAP
jgi:hypothetical protein